MGEVPSELIGELQGVARGLARGGRLPPSFAPYGHWDDEAGEELFASWYSDRLIDDRKLLALLDRATDLDSLRRLAGRSLRQHLLNAQDRSQLRNIFSRLVGLLDGESDYVLVLEASRRQDRWYGLAGSVILPRPWSGPERQLLAHAWALGDFTVVRYRAGAAKLSPVLDTAELNRFARGLLERSEAALTPGLVMRALAARFAVSDFEVDVLGEDEPIGAVRQPEDEVLLSDTARYIADELTTRQAAILLRGADKVSEIAAAVGCSVGTVINDQRRIADVVTRYSADTDERDALLNRLSDLLYENIDG